MNLKLLKRKNARAMKAVCTMAMTAVITTSFVSAQITGLSSSKSPYLLPVAGGVSTTSIITAPDTTNSGYKMCGIPDGLGAYDNGDGTFTLLVNHEFGNTVGVTRDHGSIGSFVSKWIINKSDLSVVSGSDLMQNVNLWNGSGYTTYNKLNPSSSAAFARFCSGDLPAASAFFNSVSGNGTQERIYMTGEESGTEGRAMANIVTGANSGNSYQLPALGRMAFENAVANPYKSDKTVVGLLDDGTGGQVYLYIGTKSNSGNEIEKAGLTNGKVYGISVSGFSIERVNSTTINNPPTPGTAFSLVDLGDVTNLTGATLNTNSVSGGVTSFSRPEDGAWDPRHLNDFYFNTTDQIDQVNDGVGTQVGRSRVWRLRFTDISNPELGGTIEAVLDGTEGQVMLDNLGIDNYGHILLQEDVGNSVHNGKIWQYNIASDVLTMIAKHDTARFGDITIAATAPYNVDEESSGIIDVQSILGAGKFLFDDQAHYSLGGDAVEDGQLLALYNPDTYNSSIVSLNFSGSNVTCNGGNNGSVNLTVNGGAAPYSFLWSNGSTNEDLTSVAAGTYEVTVTDDLGTTATGSFTVSQPTALAVSIVTQPAPCGSNIGFATANPSGGTPKKIPANPTYSYLWSDGRTLKAIGGLYPGTYTVTVTDSLGCSVTNFATIANTDIQSVTATTTKLTCGQINGTACVSIAGGVAPFTYEWNTSPVQTSACATGLNAGTYEVVIHTAEGCLYIKSGIKVKVAPLPAISISQINCRTLEALYVSGKLPFSYVWSSGSTKRKAAGLTPGQTYTVTITDANGCTTSDSFTPCGSSRNESNLSTDATDGFTLMPNPADDQFKINFNASTKGSCTVKVFDINGRMIINESHDLTEGINNIDMDTEGMPSGIYSVNIVFNNQSFSQKIIRK